MAFSWTLLSILAMEALNDTRGEDTMICCTCASDQVWCTSVACASSLILIPSICCSHFSCSSAMWHSSSESDTYVCTGRFNCAASQREGKKARVLNDINFTATHDHALLKDRGLMSVRRTILYLVAFCQHLSLFSELLNTDQLHWVLFLLLSREQPSKLGAKPQDCCTTCMFDLTL